MLNAKSSFLERGGKHSKAVTGPIVPFRTHDAYLLSALHELHHLVYGFLVRGVNSPASKAGASSQIADSLLGKFLTKATFVKPRAKARTREGAHINECVYSLLFKLLKKFRQRLVAVPNRIDSIHSYVLATRVARSSSVWATGQRPSPGRESRRISITMTSGHHLATDSS